MIDFTLTSSMIIYTDHSVAILISKQTTLITSNIDKLNLRLVRVSQYLFSFNLIVRHKVDKVNVVSNALSRLQASLIHISTTDEVLDTLHFATDAYHITLMKMSNDFKKKLIDVYRSNVN